MGDIIREIIPENVSGTERWEFPNCMDLLVATEMG